MNQPVTATTTPQLITYSDEVRAAILNARAAGQTCGLVPTMGALHDGHLSLVRASRQVCDFTAVTVFVNPTQFGPHEDFDRYPRDLERDLNLLGEHRVDLVFAPPPEAIYPPGFSTFVEPPEVSRPLEGKCRPGHFRGVTTVVLKLFNLVPADVAFIGQKDYQQSLVIRRMVEDLNVPIEIRVCPTVREPDGLAMSSRNAYLSPAERQRALALPRALNLAAELIARGERDGHVVIRRMQRVLDEAGVEHVDYVALAHPESLHDVAQVDGPVVALVAASAGATRLIDNRLIG